MPRPICSARHQPTSARFLDPRPDPKTMRPMLASLTFLLANPAVSYQSPFSSIVYATKQMRAMTLHSAKDDENHHPEQQADEMDDATETATLDFCRLIGRLKTTPRTGWVRRQVPGYESVADHSWRVAAMAALLFDDTDEQDTATSPTRSSDPVVMAIVHDLAECIVGDICPEDQVADKHQQEATAMQHIVQLLFKAKGSHAKLAAAFQEYETRKTYKSQLVKDLDGLDMILQACEYEQRYGMDNLDDFFQPRRFYNTKIQRLVDRIMKERAERIDTKVKIQQQDDLLTMTDRAFIEQHARASPLSDDAISNVIVALRQWELKKR